MQPRAFGQQQKHFKLNFQIHNTECNFVSGPRESIKAHEQGLDARCTLALVMYASISYSNFKDPTLIFMCIRTPLSDLTLASHAIHQ